MHLVATAGSGEGRGHLVRALTLAEALVRRGAAITIELVRGELEGALAARAAALGIVPADAAPTGAFLVVDLPDPSHAAERGPAEHLAVFDDRDAFAGRAAIIVQPSLPDWSGPGQGDRLLAGFAYAPVAAPWTAIRDEEAVAPARPADPSERASVLVCFGGSDPSRVTDRLADAFRPTDHRRTTIVVGPDYRGRLDRLPGEVVQDPADLPDLVAASDLAVIGAGTMKFEVACLGRPALLLAVADDQVPVGPAFAATGAARYLGDGRIVEPESVRAAIDLAIADGAALRVMGRRAATVIDGRGAERIVDAIEDAASA